MAERFKPRVLQRGRNTQLSYELSSRLRCAKVYPIRAPNGSTIIIYGHEHGLRILWRGGRSFRKPTSAAKLVPSAPQLPPDAIVVIIDSDDDEPAPTKGSQPVLPKVEFEDEEGDVDPAAPYPRVLQWLDIPAGAAVVDIAVPNPPLSRRMKDLPPIFETSLVVAVACSDSSVRVLSCSLTPPTADMKKRLSQPGYGGLMREAKLIAGPKGHQSMPSNISLTWTSREAHMDEEEDEYDVVDDDNTPRPARRSTDTEWDLLLASSSPDASGMLLISRIPIDGRQQSIYTGPIYPLQRLYLQSPPIALSFGTCTYPSKRHTQLLLGFSTGILRIYDVSPSLRQRSRSRSARRGSDVSLGSLASPSPPLGTGTWLATFSTPFISPGSTSATPFLSTRKPVIAAQWVAQGRAVMVLCADGEYGVWDVHNAAPAFIHPSVSNLVNSFSLRGFVGPSIRKLYAGNEKSNGTRSGLAPATPRTRKVREEVLFGAASPTNATAVSSPRGGLSVAGESVIIWFAGDAFLIANHGNFWKHRFENHDPSLGTGSLFGPGVLRIEGLDTQGELLSCIDQFPSEENGSTSRQPDLLVAAESRLMVLSKQNPNLDFGAQSAMTNGRSSALVQLDDEDEAGDAEMDDVFGHTDRQMLHSGELDFGGVNRMLDSMRGGRFGARTVGFAAS